MLTKFGVIDENTPPQPRKGIGSNVPLKGCVGDPARCGCRPRTKQAADALEDAPAVRVADAVADAFRK